MKKSTLFTSFLLLSLIFLNACSKKDQLGPVIDPPEQNVPAPLSAPLFDELNETIARFDPLYLQMVYKDKRSIQSIQEEATRLLMSIQQNPTSPVIQKELTELYHFNSFAELQKASNTISNNSAALKKGLLGKDLVLSKEKLHQLTEARNAFIKNKIITLEKASQKSSTGLWADNAAWILNHFHYYSQIGNLEMGLDEIDDIGGTGTGGVQCNESCCYEYKGCLINAVTNYRQHIVFWTGGGFVSGAGAGFAAGTIIPLIGNLYGAAYGGWLAGTTGYVLAVDTYMNDQKVCVLNFKACIQKKLGN